MKAATLTPERIEGRGYLNDYSKEWRLILQGIANIFYKYIIKMYNYI
jgi:hypothetical protein